jgi:glucose/arabinose dehydrogenase
VVFQPFDGARATDDYETFVDDFAHSDSLDSPGMAKYRPTGLALDQFGQLWVSDSREGRVWRIVYPGDD